MNRRIFNAFKAADLAQNPKFKRYWLDVAKSLMKVEDIPQLYNKHGVN